MAGRVKFPWSAIRIVWDEHYVSTRLLARDLGIDREGFQKRIRDENWKTPNVSTLAEDWRFVVLYLDLGDNENKLKTEQRAVRRQLEYDTSIKLLRAMIAEARAV